MTQLFLSCVLLTGFVLAPLAFAAPPTSDIVFASPDGHDLKLDLFLPDGVENPPLVVFVHGGGWMKGSYKRCRTKWLVDEGFALASIGYRLSDVAKFPAQLHDCKAAIRWLRAHAEDYGYDATRIGVAGTSAGGHLVLMLGVTAEVPELEGDIGEYTAEDSSVQAVVNYYGPTDFVYRAKHQPAKTDQPGGGVYELLGEPVQQNLERARLASPVTHVSPRDPPLLTLHGDMDKTVRVDQARLIDAAYSAAGLKTTLQIVEGGGHGGDAFFTGQNRELVVSFLRRYLSQPATSGTTSR